MILILGDKADPHIRKVRAHLKVLRSPSTILDPFEAVELPGLFFRTARKQSFSAIWDRLKPVAIPPSNRGQYILRERLANIRALQLVHDRCRLMNHPGDTEAAKSKPHQLKVAQEAGLLTPRTYVGNDPKIIRDFVAGCTHGAIAKSLTWFFDSTNRFSFSKVVTLKTLPSDASLALSPMIYQEYIPKDSELRVTCVDSRLFAVKIFSQENERTLIDWRRDQFNLKYETAVLPEALKKKVMRVQKALGLHFGAFDFILTPEGEHVFLEVNSSGNWLWLEDDLALPISLTIARWLAGKGRDGAVACQDSPDVTGVFRQRRV